jgi:hypothetical protein
VRALSTFRKAYLIGFLACVGYVVIPWLLGTVARYSGVPDPMVATIVLALIYFIFILSARYFLYRKQFRALDFRLGVRLESPAVAIGRAVLNPKYEGYIVRIFISMMALFGLTAIIAEDAQSDLAWRFPAVEAGVLVAATLHLGMVMAFWFRAHRDRNLKFVTDDLRGRRPGSRKSYAWPSRARRGSIAPLAGRSTRSSLS